LDTSFSTASESSAANLRAIRGRREPDLGVEREGRQRAAGTLRPADQLADLLDQARGQREESQRGQLVG